MSRRELNRTDESTTSITSSLAEMKSTAMSYFTESIVFDDQKLRESSPQYVLNRMLSTKSWISTTSSTAMADQAAFEDITLGKFHEIGRGQCGSVWSRVGNTKVLKIPNAHTDQDRLWVDACVHKQVQEAFEQAPSVYRQNICIPRMEKWVRPQDVRFWTEYNSFFPSHAGTPNYGLLSERIFALPFPVREAIVDALCPKKFKCKKEEILADPINKNCLVRIYLGRRDVEMRAKSSSFRLRNFELLVNEMEVLGLDTSYYAEIMADALAILHWRAGIDGNDVEFILGSSPMSTNPLLAAEMAATDKDGPFGLPGFEFDFKKRSVHMWLIDFNMCHRIDIDDKDRTLDLLTKAFWFNDPYYPRPVSEQPSDVEMWQKFSRRYLNTSAAFTTNSLPKKFIEAIEAAGEERREKIKQQGKSSLFGEVMK